MPSLKPTFAAQCRSRAKQVGEEITRSQNITKQRTKMSKYYNPFRDNKCLKMTTTKNQCRKET